MPGALISLDDARATLGMSATDTSKDGELSAYIDAATPIMEDLCGPLLARDRVETYDGGRPQIVLLFAPLISVTSVVESYGSTYERTLTEQHIFDGSPVGAYGFTVDLVSGQLTRRVSGVVAPFPNGRRNVQVSYTSGRAEIGGNILLAARRLVRHLWQSERQGFRPGKGRPADDVGYTPSGFAVPRAVIEMCAADIRPPGLA